MYRFVMLFHDSTRCSYFGEELAGVLIAIGWLNDTERFETGPTPPRASPWAVELCRFAAGLTAMRDARR